MYKDLLVWQKSMALVKALYMATESYPQSEQYGLKSQLRRAAVSVPSNIAEGSSRESNKEFLRFLYIARGSLAELTTQIILSKELAMMHEKDAGELSAQTDEVGKMINGLIRKIDASR